MKQSTWSKIGKLANEIPDVTRDEMEVAKKGYKVFRTNPAGELVEIQAKIIKIIRQMKRIIKKEEGR